MLPANLFATVSLESILRDTLAFPLARKITLVASLYEDANDLVVRDAVLVIIVRHFVEFRVNMMAVRNERTKKLGILAAG